MNYPNIDMRKTGIKLKNLASQSGYTVKQIQEYLHLSCPQPIYKWFKGQRLPSLEHIYALSKLRCVPMEDLIVEELKIENIVLEWDKTNNPNQRYLLYCSKLVMAA